MGGGRVLLRIATELTMFGLQFQKSYWDGFMHFHGFGGEKIVVI